MPRDLKRQVPLPGAELGRAGEKVRPGSGAGRSFFPAGRRGLPPGPAPDPPSRAPEGGRGHPAPPVDPRPDRQQAPGLWLPGRPGGGRSAPPRGGLAAGGRGSRRLRPGLIPGAREEFKALSRQRQFSSGFTTSREAAFAGVFSTALRGNLSLPTSPAAATRCAMLGVYRLVVIGRDYRPLKMARARAFNALDGLTSSPARAREPGPASPRRGTKAHRQHLAPGPRPLAWTFSPENILASPSPAGRPRATPAPAREGQGCRWTRSHRLAARRKAAKRRARAASPPTRPRTETRSAFGLVLLALDLDCSVEAAMETSCKTASARRRFHYFTKKNASRIGKLGAKKGGDARAAALSPARRREIARDAALARWARRVER